MSDVKERPWWACVDCRTAWPERDEASVRGVLGEAFGKAAKLVSQEDVDVEMSVCPSCGWIGGVRAVADVWGCCEAS
jgi:hypothetical protein